MLPAQDRPAASPIAVQIHPEQVLARTSRRFLGFGYETSALARPGYFSPRNATLIQLLKNLGQGGLLRIGGNVSDYAHYEPDGRPQAMPQRQRTVYTRTELTE